MFFKEETYCDFGTLPGRLAQTHDSDKVLSCYIAWVVPDCHLYHKLVLHILYKEASRQCVTVSQELWPYTQDSVRTFPECPMFFSIYSNY